MTQHTPGPWIVSGLLDTGAGFDWVNADGPQAVAKICVPSPHPNVVDAREMAKANARLIAAAPELLEALRDLIIACNMSPGQELTVSLAIE
ncbi:hypothetical protein LCGC14_2956660, partial [marine sediment metagenome]